MNTQRLPRLLRLLAALLVASLALVACGDDDDASTGDSDDDAASEDAGTITVTDNHGEIEVPVNPERVVALDNTTFSVIEAMGVELVAAPKPLMGTLWPVYTEDDSILDVGLHTEPNVEAVIEAEPDLIISGSRMSSIYDDLRDIQPATIELNPRDGEDHTSELKRATTVLGQIFGQEDLAAEINADLDAAIAAAAEAYDPSQTVMGLITSQNSISYASPTDGRAVSPLFAELGLTPALDQDGSSDHMGDDISLEAIAASNPDWLIILDRDGALQVENYVPALDLIAEAEALQNVTAVVKNQIVVLDPGFYLNEGIHAYTALYQALAEAFSAAG